MPATQLYHIEPGSKITFEDLDPDAWPYYIVIGTNYLKTMPEKYKNAKGEVRAKVSARAPDSGFNRQPLFLVTKYENQRLGTVLEA